MALLLVPFDKVDDSSQVRPGTTLTDFEVRYPKTKEPTTGYRIGFPVYAAVYNVLGDAACLRSLGYFERSTLQDRCNELREVNQNG